MTIYLFSNNFFKERGSVMRTQMLPETELKQEAKVFLSYDANKMEMEYLDEAKMIQINKINLNQIIKLLNTTN